MDWNMILKMSLAVLLYVLITAVLWRLCRDRKPFGTGLKILIGLAFGVCSVAANHIGIQSYNESILLNVRDIGPLSAGLFFSPLSGIIAGIIGGGERYLAGELWHIGQFTVVACSLSTSLAGFLAAFLHKWIYKGKRTSVPHAFFLFFFNIQPCKTAERPVHGKEMILKSGPVRKLFKRAALPDGKAAGSRSDQGAHAGAYMQCIPDVPAKRTDVCPFSADYPEPGSPIRFPAQNPYFVDMHRPCREIERLTVSCEIVQPDPIPFQGGHHWRYLQDIPFKFRKRRGQIRVRNRSLFPGNFFPVYVERIRGQPGNPLGNVFLPAVGEEIKQPGRLSDHHGKHAGGVRIERAGVADPSSPWEKPAYRDHRIAACHSRRFQERQKPFHRSNFSRINDRTSFSASSSVV